MDAIRITDLPVLSAPEERDIVHFQRLVDGTWQDFRTDFATLQGEVRTFIQPVDLSDSYYATVYTPDTDELAVPLAMWMVATPGTPSGGPPVWFSVQFFNVTSGGSALDITAAIGTDPAVYNAIDVVEIFGFDSALELTWASNNATGTAVIFCQYAILPKV